MKIVNWLKQSTAQLQNADIPTARLDCLVLLCDLLGKDKAFVLAHPEATLTTQQLSTLDTQLEKRASHTPLAYIRGFSEFYGRSFFVTKNVLEPRPESESIIDLLKKISTEGTVIDVGTGSGALAITAKLELSSADVYAVDISADCISIAKKNSAALNGEVIFRKGNLLNPFSDIELHGSVLLANLPYVPNTHVVNRAATHEPALAIFGGHDGLDLYRTLFQQISESSKPSHIITESLLTQHASLRDLAAKYSYSQTARDGLVQVFTASAQPQV
jgi:release factor glutamine methyltransferase